MRNRSAVLSIAIINVAYLASLDHVVASSISGIGVISASVQIDAKNKSTNDDDVADVIGGLTVDNSSADENKTSKPPTKPNIRLPNLWGRRTKPVSKPNDDAAKAALFPDELDAADKTNSESTEIEEGEKGSSSEDGNSSKSGDEAKGSSAEDDKNVQSSSEKDSVSEEGIDKSKNEAENKSNEKISDSENVEEKNDSSLSDTEKSSETNLTNQTRPTVLYLSPPQGSMVPHSRPMTTYPYMPPPHPHHAHPQHQRQNPPSLLSSILSAFFGPQNKPPPSPYGPPMPPSSPYGPNNNSNEVAMLLSTVLSLMLRLAILSFTSHILDLFGGHSDSTAFLPSPAQHYTFERVNDRYRRDEAALMQALASPPPGLKKSKWKRVFGRRRKENVKTLMELDQLEDNDAGGTVSSSAMYNRTVIIIDMKPDSRVGNGVAEQLRDTVSFLIEQHRDHLDRRRNDLSTQFANSLSQRLPSNVRTHRGVRAALGTDIEVLLLLDSPGGTVQDYGLASSHLTRLRDEPHITLSVCVDRVAASGGYMMACQASPGRLMAAPFAMVGSIGVLMETVNFHEVLRKYGVDPIVIKAGKSKAPLKALGEITPEEKELAQQDADTIHEAFRQWVLKSRPNVVVSDDWVEKVMTGAVFLGKEAQELGLVDRVVTSDEYIAERIAAGDRVLRLIPYKGPQFGFKLSPLDLLLLGDAEGRARIREKCNVLRLGVIQWIAPLFRVGSAVGVLNLVHHLATLNNNPSIAWRG